MGPVSDISVIPYPQTASPIVDQIKWQTPINGTSWEPISSDLSQLLSG